MTHVHAPSAFLLVKPMTPKRVLRSVLGLVMLGGLIVALWPLGQTAYSQWSQRELKAQWQQQAKVKDRESKITDRKLKTAHSEPETRNAKLPWPATRIVIPDASTDVVVLDGWEESTLRKAPGHLPGSANPGEKGNCVIAGHRNVYGSPFYHVDGLTAGAPIELRTPDATYTYNVIAVFGATDSDQTVLRPPTDPNAKPLLTLITCTIPRTSNRIIVQAELASS